jgi:glycosyltransferase involved in cell wall biosynthesis
MSIQYKLCNYIWYREYTAIDYLEKNFKDKLVFIPNSVSIKNKKKNNKNKFVFLWVNTMKYFRRIDWFMEILNEDEFLGVKTAILGVSSERKILNCYDLSSINKSIKNITILNFTDPTYFYKNSKFFILPSDFVYCNNSLLEAMSFGVVPIVSNIDNADKIIENNVSGILFTHSVDGLRGAMKYALHMDDKSYKIMSMNAKKKVKKDFSDLKYKERMINFYNIINKEGN